MSQDVQTIKYLQTRISQLRGKLNSLLAHRDDLNKEISASTSEVKKMESELSRIQQRSKDPIVSEHAIIRYLERVQGLNVEQVKNEILTDDLKKCINMFGSGKFPVNKFKAVVRERVVVTIVGENEE